MVTMRASKGCIMALGSVNCGGGDGDENVICGLGFRWSGVVSGFGDL